MAALLHSVEIFWNEGNDTHLTEVISSDPVLKTFFEIDGWASIHDMSKCVALHLDYDTDDKGFSFVKDAQMPTVKVYTSQGEEIINESAFINLSLYLFELLIAGANDNHHTIRYEPWWQAFIEYMYQIQDQVH